MNRCFRDRGPIFIGPLALVLGMLMLTSGCGWFGGKSQVIQQAIKALEDRKPELLSSHPEIADARFYKDPEGDGVTIEYIYRAGTEIDESYDEASVKTRLIAQFKDNEGIKKVLGLGVYLRLLFKTADDQIVADVKLTDADL